MLRRLLPLALALLSPALLHAQAASNRPPLVRETFEEDDLKVEAQKGHTLKVAWSVEEKGTLNIVDDGAGLSSGKALQTKGVIGALPPSILDNPGDTVAIAFDFRLLKAPAAPAVLRFGLYEFDDVSGSKDAFDFENGRGYRLTGTLGDAPKPAVIELEQGTGTQVFQGNNVSQIAASPAPFSINDTAKHSVKLVLTLNDAGGLVATVTIDGKLLNLSGTDPMPPDEILFNRFALSGGGNVLLFDNFSVDAQMQGAAAQSTTSPPPLPSP
jgi:hypothetical protein